MLHSLKSATNVGMIVRTHVAFGGQEVVFVVGSERPWEFRKQSQAFSRKLEKLCELVFIETDEEFFSWCTDRQLSTVALEISSDSSPLRNFQFPDRTALLVVGNEGERARRRIHGSL